MPGSTAGTPPGAAVSRCAARPSVRRRGTRRGCGLPRCSPVLSHALQLCISVRYQPSLESEFEQRLLQRSSSSMQPTHYRTDRNVEDVGNLLIGEALNIREQHGHAELLGQSLK